MIPDIDKQSTQVRAIIGFANDPTSRHFILVPGSKKLFALPGYTGDDTRVADKATLEAAAKKAGKIFTIDKNYPIIRKDREYEI